MQNNNQWPEEIKKIASIIAKFPLEKKQKWGSDVYTYKGNNIVSFGGFKNYFAIWFYKGVFINDTYNVLISAQQKTISLKQWRLTHINDINENILTDYVLQAIEIENKGLKIKPKKIKEIAIPELLHEELTKDANLNSSFFKLTPGNQKLYIEYINEAKYLTTKINRLQKIIPNILNGVGLNDKYK